MNTVKKLIRGKPGTKKWIKKFGDDLICVRYRYDSEQNERMITVELKVDTGKWEKNKKRIPENKTLNIKVNYEELDLRNKIKSFGGIWNKQKKVWELPYKYVKSLNLKDRIIS